MIRSSGKRVTDTVIEIWFYAETIALHRLAKKAVLQTIQVQSHYLLKNTNGLNKIATAIVHATITAQMDVLNVIILYVLVFLLSSTIFIIVNVFARFLIDLIYAMGIAVQIKHATKNACRFFLTKQRIVLAIVVVLKVVLVRAINANLMYKFYARDIK